MLLLCKLKITNALAFIFGFVTALISYFRNKLFYNEPSSSEEVKREPYNNEELDVLLDNLQQSIIESLRSQLKIVNTEKADLEVEKGKLKGDIKKLRARVKSLQEKVKSLQENLDEFTRVPTFPYNESNPNPICRVFLE